MPGRALHAVCITVNIAAIANSGDIVGHFKLDPVELTRGREIPGNESIAAEHYRYRYWFSNAENRDEFVRNPAKYEIQLGGACARMGPLSGLGSTDIFAVHDGRLFIFASEQCRAGFLTAPEKLLEAPEPAPAADPASRDRALKMLDKAIEAMGGAAAVDAIKTFRQEHRQEREHQGRAVVEKNIVTIRFPDRARHDYCWGDATYSEILTADDAWFVSPEQHWTMHEQQRDAMIRQYLSRNLIHVLQSRKLPGAVVAHLGAELEPAMDGSPQLERVAVAHHGTTSVLGIDLKTGRICTQSFRGRGPRLTIGEMKRVFGEPETIGNFRIPTMYTSYFDGENLDKTTALRIEIDGVIAPSVFARPDAQ